MKAPTGQEATSLFHFGRSLNDLVFLYFILQFSLTVSPTASRYCQEGLAGKMLFESSQRVTKGTK